MLAPGRYRRTGPPCERACPAGIRRHTAPPGETSRIGRQKKAERPSRANDSDPPGMLRPMHRLRAHCPEPDSGMMPGRNRSRPRQAIHRAGFEPFTKGDHTAENGKPATDQKQHHGHVFHESVRKRFSIRAKSSRMASREASFWIASLHAGSRRANDSLANVRRWVRTLGEISRNRACTGFPSRAP